MIRIKIPLIACIAVALVSTALLPRLSRAQSSNGDVVGQVTAGYQGWFSAG
jgi:hypothetical protein